MRCPNCSIDLASSSVPESLSHVNACEGVPSPSVSAVNDPVSEVLLDQAGRVSKFDHLFLVRFHSAIAALGEPSADGGWPHPDVAWGATS